MGSNPTASAARMRTRPGIRLTKGHHRRGGAPSPCAPCSPPSCPSCPSWHRGSPDVLAVRVALLAFGMRQQRAPRPRVSRRLLGGHRSAQARRARRMGPGAGAASGRGGGTERPSVPAATALPVRAVTVVFPPLLLAWVAFLAVRAASGGSAPGSRHRLPAGDLVQQREEWVGRPVGEPAGIALRERCARAGAARGPLRRGSGARCGVRVGCLRAGATRPRRIPHELPPQKLRDSPCMDHSPVDPRETGS